MNIFHYMKLKISKIIILIFIIIFLLILYYSLISYNKLDYHQCLLFEGLFNFWLNQQIFGKVIDINKLLCNFSALYSKCQYCTQFTICNIFDFKIAIQCRQTSILRYNHFCFFSTFLCIHPLCKAFCYFSFIA